MQEKYSVTHLSVGIVHVDCATGALSWEQKQLDPVIKSYVKKYLFDEGFIEQALGILHPIIDQQTTSLLQGLSDS